MFGASLAPPFWSSELTPSKVYLANHMRSHLNRSGFLERRAVKSGTMIHPGTLSLRTGATCM